MKPGIPKQKIGGPDGLGSAPLLLCYAREGHKRYFVERYYMSSGFVCVGDSSEHRPSLWAYIEEPNANNTLPKGN
jgi:hypothetical protein